MKILYLECSMGVAGDMLMAALYDVMNAAQQRAFMEQMNALGLPGVELIAESSTSYGFCGTRMHVVIDGVEESDTCGHECGHHTHGCAHGRHHEHDHAHGHTHEHRAHEHHVHEHKHASAHDHAHTHATPGHIAQVIDGLSVGDRVRREARAVYDNIARAEAAAHGLPIDDVHYHEVGALDAVADVVGVCLALDMLAVNKVVVSPIHVGSGTVRCAHGMVSVPAPATAHLLAEAPIYGGNIQGELCTPTGAALVVHFASSFGPMPLMTCGATGYGLGKHDFGQANMVRAFLGQARNMSGGTADAGSAAYGGETPVVGDVTGASGAPNIDVSTNDSTNSNGEICEIVCNIDDMTPEALAHACSRLIERGALDAYTLAGTMKKGRAAHQLTVLCKTSQTEAIVKAVLEETTTIGVRAHICQKWSLTPHFESIETPWGNVRIKVSEGFGLKKVKPEYADVAQIAHDQGMPIQDVSAYVLAHIN